MKFYCGTGALAKFNFSLPVHDHAESRSGSKFSSGVALSTVLLLYSQKRCENRRFVVLFH